MNHVYKVLPFLFDLFLYELMFLYIFTSLFKALHSAYTMETFFIKGNSYTLSVLLEHFSEHDYCYLIFISKYIALL